LGAGPPFAVGPFNSSGLSKSWAVFGDTSYRLTERLTLGAGLRDFQDDQESTSSAGPTAITQTKTFHSVNPRAYAQFKLTDQVNAYSSAAKGFRSGGFNLLDQPSYGPESVWTYELGSKMSALAGHLSADLAIFYSDYTDYQVVGILPNGPPVGITSNAGSARIKGVEWALTLRPTTQWTLSFDGNYVSSNFYEIEATSSSYAVGDRLDLFPRYSYTVSAQHGFKWSAREGFARVDYNQQGPMTYRSRRIPSFYNESDVINMLNLSMGVQWNQSLSLNLFAKNLLDDRGFTDPFSIEDVASRSRSRTYGFEFSMSLN